MKNPAHVNAPEHADKLVAQRIKKLVHYSLDTTCIIDAEANYLFIADPTKSVFGYQAGFFRDKNAFDFIHPDDALAVRDSLKSIPLGISTHLPNYRFRAAGGQWHWIQSHATSLLDDLDVKGIVVSSRDVSEKKQLLGELERALQQRRHHLQRAVVQAQQQERKAIGEELHDNVNQLLTAAKLYMNMLHEPGRAHDLLPKAITYIQESIDEIRKISTRLILPASTQLNLSEAIKELLVSMGRPAGLVTDVTCDIVSNTAIAEEIELAIYRIIQEQVINIIKHAKASKLSLALVVKNRRIFLTIKDDGVGFNPLTTKKGLGLSNMQHRAELVNGWICITSSPGEGCVLNGEFRLKTSVQH